MKYTDQTIEGYLEFLEFSRNNFILTEAEEQELLEFITMDKLKAFSQDKMKIIEKVLIKFKVNVSSIRSTAKSQAAQLKKEFDAGKSPEEISKQVSKQVGKAAAVEMKNLRKKAWDASIGQKIWFCVAMFFIIFYFNTLIGMLLASVLSNPVVINNIVAIVIGPMVEEAVKTYFIEQGIPWMGTGIVFGLELVHYVTNVMFGGITVVSKYLLARLTSLLMHFGTTWIQKKIIESGEAKGEDRRFIAWVVAVGVHASWNALSIYYMNDKVTSWINK